MDANERGCGRRARLPRKHAAGVWVGVEEGKTVQLDDLIVLETIMPDGTPVTYYGFVDQVTKKFEGNAFDTDAFHVADHSLPVEVSYAAHVQVTRLDPEVFVPPHPGTPAQIVRGEAFQKALYSDRMERKIPIGLTRSGEAIYANLEFLGLRPLISIPLVAELGAGSFAGELPLNAGPITIGLGAPGVHAGLQ
jgi:hypothetical protein